MKSCKACVRSVTAAIKKPSAKKMLDRVLLTKRRPKLWPILTVAPDVRVTFRPRRALPKVACFGPVSCLTK